MRTKDKHGNKLYLGDTGLYLKLDSEHRLRKIFTFSSGKIVKNIRKANIFKFGNNHTPSVGFNYFALQLIKDRTRQEYIYVILGNKIRRIAITEILDKGEFLHFLKEGFELQIFYPLDDMEQIKKGER